MKDVFEATKKQIHTVEAETLNKLLMDSFSEITPGFPEPTCINPPQQPIDNYTLAQKINVLDCFLVEPDSQCDNVFEKILSLPAHEKIALLNERYDQDITLLQIFLRESLPQQCQQLLDQITAFSAEQKTALFMANEKKLNVDYFLNCLNGLDEVASLCLVEAFCQIDKQVFSSGLIQTAAVNFFARMAYEKPILRFIEFMNSFDNEVLTTLFFGETNSFFNRSSLNLLHIGFMHPSDKVVDKLLACYGRLGAKDQYALLNHCAFCTKDMEGYFKRLNPLNLVFGRSDWFNRSVSVMQALTKDKDLFALLTSESDYSISPLESAARINNLPALRYYIGCFSTSAYFNTVMDDTLRQIEKIGKKMSSQEIVTLCKLHPFLRQMRQEANISVEAEMFSDLQRWLRSYPAIGHCRLGKERTLLHWAVLTDNPAIVGLLIDNGSLVDARDVNDKTPLDYAIELGQTSSIDLLSLCPNEKSVVPLACVLQKGNYSTVKRVLLACKDIDKGIIERSLIEGLQAFNDYRGRLSLEKMTSLFSTSNQSPTSPLNFNQVFATYCEDTQDGFALFLLQVAKTLQKDASSPLWTAAQAFMTQMLEGLVDNNEAIEERRWQLALFLFSLPPHYLLSFWDKVPKAAS